MSEATSNAPPPLAVGHLSLTVADLEASYRFYSDLGLRSFGKGDDMAILELRGGTHLLLFQRGGPVGQDEGPFAGVGTSNIDLMLGSRSRDELQALHGHLVERGHAPEPIPDRQFFGHHLFRAKDPDGNAVTISTSHASDQPI
jgi:catechol 2,3-dioxygenase-like lactoylglutathione lyase family enzyme